MTSLAAGYLFDTMGPTSPFVVTGLLHLFTALAAVAVLVRRGGVAKAAVTAEAAKGREWRPRHDRRHGLAI